MPVSTATQPLKTAAMGSASRNLFWLLGDKIFRLGLGLFVTAWLVRYLKPEAFGLYNFAIAFVWIFENFTTVGLNEIIMRDVAQRPESLQQLLGSASVLKLAGSIVSFLIIWAIISLLKPGDGQTIHLVILMSLSMIVRSAGVVRLYFDGSVLSKYNVIADGIAFVFGAMLRIYLIYFQYPLIYFAGAILAEALLAAAFLYFFYGKNVGSFSRWRADARTMMELFRDSWMVIFSAFSFMLYMRCDQVLLKFIAGNEAAGIYSAAARLSEIWYFLPSAVIASVFPKLLQQKMENRDQFRQNLQRLFNILSFICLGVAVLTSLLGGFAIGIIFGADYLPSAPILSVHIWSGTFLILYIASSKFLISEGMQRYDLLRTIVGAVLNIGLNLLFIPKFGGLGSAWATLLSYAVSLFVPALFVRGRTLGRMMLQSLSPLYLLRFAAAEARGRFYKNRSLQIK